MSEPICPVLPLAAVVLSLGPGVAIADGCAMVSIGRLAGAQQMPGDHGVQLQHHAKTIIIRGRT